MQSRNSITGVLAAITIIGLWVGSLAAFFSLEFAPKMLAIGLPWMTFLSTGLFITAHDAMHGTVSSNRRVNDALGAVAVGLYALFSYRKLARKHAQHHVDPAVPGLDPDFHDGEHRGFWRWYLHFVRGYVGIWQIVGMAAAFNVLSHIVGVPEPQLLAFWVIPVLLSTLQLFAFGTYLPHRGEHAADNVHRARTSDYPPWLSFLTCYHFGYHREHHERPDVPWWGLPGRRRPSVEPGSSRRP